MTFDLDVDCSWDQLLACLRAPASFSRHSVLSGAWPPAAKFEAWAEMGAAKSGSSTIFIDFVWHNAQGPSVFGAEFENAHGLAHLVDAHVNYKRLPGIDSSKELIAKIEDLLATLSQANPEPQAFDRWLAHLKKKN